MIVFTIRGCQTAWLGAYGNEWIGTPHLDRIAAEGVVFDNHYSDCPDPDAAARAWRTGLDQTFPHPEDSPSHTKANRDLLDSLRTAGVKTAIVRANQPVSDISADFYAGWDEVFDARPELEQTAPLGKLIDSLPGLLDRLATSAKWLLWIDFDRLLPPWKVNQEVFEAYREDPPEEEEWQHQDGGITAVDDEDFRSTEASEYPTVDETVVEEIDSAENHENPDDDEPEALEELSDASLSEERMPAEQITPWDDPPTGPFESKDLAAWEWLHQSFAAVMTAFDAELGRIFEIFRDRKLDAQATWVITSDLGFPLGQHDRIGLHVPWLYQEVVHLPLLIRLPHAGEAGRRVSAITQPSDLHPLILQLFEISPEDFDTRTPLDLISGKITTLRTHARSSLEIDGISEWSVRTAEWAYLLPNSAEGLEKIRTSKLFLKPDDRWEVNDVLGQYPEIAEELRLLLVQSK